MAKSSASCSPATSAGPAAVPLGLMDNLRDELESDVTSESRQRVHDILHSVQTLSDLEKLLLYLQLPCGGGIGIGSEAGGPHQPQPPGQLQQQLSNQAEQTHANTWILSHLEEDPSVCLRKDEVYSDYRQYCEAHGCKPLNTADFGKAMKRAFPGVKPRRLGQRGQSKYCYGGLRKQTCPPSPRLPGLLLPPPPGSLLTQAAAAPSDAIDGGTGFHDSVVVEWAQKLLGAEFASMRTLAEHLVANQYINPGFAPALSALACRRLGGGAGRARRASSPPPAAHSGRRYRDAEGDAQSPPAASLVYPAQQPYPLPPLLLPSPYRGLRRPLPPFRPLGRGACPTSDEEDEDSNAAELEALGEDAAAEGSGADEAMDEDPVGYIVGRGLAMISPPLDRDGSRASSPPLLDWCQPGSPPVRPLHVQLPTDAAAAVAVIVAGSESAFGATADVELMDIAAIGR